MRILVSAASQVLTDHRPHGEGLICYQVLSRLARRGHELHVFIAEVALNEPLPGARLYQVPDRMPFAALRWWRFQVESVRRARAICRQSRIDVVHHLMPFYLGEHFSLVGGAPLVVGPIFPNWPLGPADLDQLPVPPRRFGPAGQVARDILGRAAVVLQRRTLARAAGVLISATAVERELPGAVRGKSVLVPFGVDTDRFRPAEPVGSDARPTILFLANLLRRKGLEYLLRALPIVLIAIPAARLVVVGGGPSEGYFRRLAGDLHLDAAVEFVGPVSSSATLPYFQQCDVYCLPSLGEPFGISLLEAMACGKPVVATNAGGPPDFVAEGQSGYLVPPRDSNALAAALVRLLADPQLRKSAGGFNRERCVREYRWEAVTEKIENVYQRVSG
ncbi:MAG: glycosyltransferase family 4 protein [Chloroflexi bacterium]|nr:glycosyltransferase family 4 protein [Chloroflexota bacterium]